MKHTVFISVLVLLFTSTTFAGSQFGPRIPTAYVVTSGVGQSDDGIPPDPYETFSYDLALKQAGIEDFNVMYYTSVLPPEAHEVPIDKVKQHFHHGAVLEAIMSKSEGYKGDTLVAGVGRVWAVNAKGEPIGGYAAEYTRKYAGKKVDAIQAGRDARQMLTKSLKHELTIRGLTQTGEMKFEIASIHVEKKYGIALAALGFLNFIYPDPIPVK